MLVAPPDQVQVTGADFEYYVAVFTWPDGQTFDPFAINSLSIVSEAGPCKPNVTGRGLEGCHPRFTYVQRTLPSPKYNILVGSVDGRQGNFTITVVPVTTITPLSAPANENFTNPITLVPGEPVIGNNANATNWGLKASLTSAYWGPWTRYGVVDMNGRFPLWYTFAVPGTTQAATVIVVALSALAVWWFFDVRLHSPGVSTSLGPTPPPPPRPGLVAAVR